MNKTKKQQQTIDLDSDESTEAKLDLSVLRKPIITSVTGFDEMLRAYADGTSELKQLMSKECDIIYECKVCRNIFRSLANFISHKRVYCRARFNTSEHFHFPNNGYVDQDVSTIIQAEQDINQNPYASSIVNGQDDRSRDLSSIVERLLRRQHQTQNSNELCDDVKDDSSETSSRKSQTLKLDKLSNVAVYQSLQQDNESNDMKTEVNEVHNLNENRQNNTVLGPDGKVLTLFCASSSSASSSHAQPDSPVEENFVCDVCTLKFETEKTLKTHIEIKHQPSTYVHQCPLCNQSFSQPAAVYRHLSNDHKKSSEKIRQMREKIIKKRIRADEVVPKPANRELTSLDLNVDDDMVWMDKEASDQYQCIHCKKGFERKASYTSHIASCPTKAKTNRRRRPKKILGVIESEENSNMSEPGSVISEVTNDSSQNNRRKRKRTSKIEHDLNFERAFKMEKLDEEEEVDWNLDDEEEKLKLENIKKEIIADDYEKQIDGVEKFKAIVKQEKIDHELDQSNDLVIDEKMDDSGVRSLNSTAQTEEETPIDESLQCSICEKVFKDIQKRNDHVINYHGRQKRFKCSLCNYHGYRRTDTINHLNAVHQMTGGKDTLATYMEVVMKSVDPEEILKQTQLKKQRFLQMRQKKLEKQGKDVREDVKIKEEPEEKALEQTVKEEKLEPAIDQKDEETEDSHASSTHAENDSFQSESNDASDVKLPTKKPRRSKISQYGRIVKNPASMSSGSGKDTKRPVRNRIKPVNKDFVYDLSGLLSGREGFEADQLKDLKEDLPPRRESTRRKCTLQPSTSFNGTVDSKILSDEEFESDFQNFSKFLTEPAKVVPVEKKNDPVTTKSEPEDEDVPLSKLKEIPAVEVEKKEREPNKDKEIHGPAHKAAISAVTANRASMFEPQYLPFISFTPKVPPLLKLVAPKHNTIVPVTPIKSEKKSISSSILEKYNKLKSQEKSAKTPEKVSTLSPEQLCKKFEQFNVNSMESEEPATIKVEAETPSEFIAFMCETEGETFILKELSPADSDNEPKNVSSPMPESSGIKKHGQHKKMKKIQKRPKFSSRSATSASSGSIQRSCSKKSIEKRKHLSSSLAGHGNAGSSSSQRRMTVLQRVLENKKKNSSREQLIKRLLTKKSSAHRSNFNIFNET